MTNKLNILKIASVYTAVILGAGFASGQELTVFFVKNKTMGFVGLLFSGFLFSLVGIATLLICYKYKLKSYNEFIKFVIGNKFSLLLEIVIAIFLFTIFVAMLAGGSIAISEAFFVDKTLSAIIIAGLCFITFLYDLDGIVELNTILAPFMVIGILFIGLYTFFNLNTPIFINSNSIDKNNWLLLAVLYSSYNLITSISVLSSMGNVVSNAKVAVWGAILGGVVITVLGICLFFPLYIASDSIAGTELPIYTLLQNYGQLITYFYLLVLLVAIFTTAIANGFAFIEWLSLKLNINKLIIKFFVVLFALLASKIGFSSLVKNVYPIFGYIGIFEILIILIVFFKYVVLGKKR